MHAPKTSISTKNVTNHYANEQLLARIRDGLQRLGKTTDTVTIDDLAPVDEFHIGGRVATEHFLGQLGFRQEETVLDIGCGLGGAARYLAHDIGCSVRGFDLTPDYVVAGNMLSSWVGLSDRVTLAQGSALNLPLGDQTCDGGYMMHVGMNVADKAELFRETGRVVRAGGTFGVYDIMRDQDGPLQFPVPWATDALASALARPEEYRELLEAGGFEIMSMQSRREAALEFCETICRRSTDSSGPPPLGLHLLMQESTATKVGNMIANIQAGLIAPVEIIARKR